MERPFIIAIDGFGASGKSTLAEKLRDELQSCAVVEMDSFCYPPSGNDGEWWGQAGNCGVDWQRMKEQVLTPAREGKEFKYQGLNWDGYRLEWSPEIKACSFLIVEGLHALRRELRDYYDLKIWIDSPDETRLERVKARDGDYMIPFWEKEFIPIASAYYREHEPRKSADLILNMGQGPEKIFEFRELRTLRSRPAPG